MTDPGDSKQPKRQRVEHKQLVELPQDRLFKKLDANVWLVILELVGRQESVPLYATSKSESALVRAAGHGIRRLTLHGRSFWLLLRDDSDRALPDTMCRTMRHSFHAYDGPTELPRFAAAMQHLSGIQELVLSQIRSLPPAKMFELAPQLTVLRISTEHTLGAPSMVDLFRHQQKLQVLDLSGYRTYVDIIPMLTEALETYGAPALRQLIFSNAYGTSSDFGRFMTCKWTGFRKLTRLEIPFWPDEKDLLNALAKCTALEHVALSIHSQKDGDARHEATTSTVECLAKACPALRHLECAVFTDTIDAKSLLAASRCRKLETCKLTTFHYYDEVQPSLLAAMVKVMRANSGLRRMEVTNSPGRERAADEFLTETMELAPALTYLSVALLPASDICKAWMAKHPLCRPM